MFQGGMSGWDVPRIDVWRLIPLANLHWATALEQVLAAPQEDEEAEEEEEAAA